MCPLCVGLTHVCTASTWALLRCHAAMITAVFQTDLPIISAPSICPWYMPCRGLSFLLFIIGFLPPEDFHLAVYRYGPSF